MSVTPMEPSPQPGLTPSEKRRRKLLLAILILLLLLLAGVSYLFVRYLNQPEPLPELLPVPVEVSYPPRYITSFYEVNGPVGVALSPRGDRIYVTEMRGDRMIKILDTDGNLLGSFAPPRTGPGERAPVYVATDSTGRVFVSDRLQHAIFVYDADGNFLDTILSPTLSLSEYIAKHTGLTPKPGTFAYNFFQGEVYYQDADGNEATLPRPDDARWAPLGIRFDANDRLLLTDLTEDAHSVMIVPRSVVMAADWLDFDLNAAVFGTSGQSDGQFLFPNSALADSTGRVIVSDGNNGRLSVWDDRGDFLFHFGVGSGDGALNLPRGMAIDDRNRLHVVDAVGQNVKVYDFSADEPAFLFAFGSIGAQSGQFNYPNDVALDATGRVYIADRENNRIQVWTY
jgi:DNA-binding beta-propeller fold protein YncE